MAAERWTFSGGSIRNLIQGQDVPHFVDDRIDLAGPDIILYDTG
jgi:hypothetical protein